MAVIWHADELKRKIESSQYFFLKKDIPVKKGIVCKGTRVRRINIKDCDANGNSKMIVTLFDKDVAYFNLSCKVSEFEDYFAPDTNLNELQGYVDNARKIAKRKVQQRNWWFRWLTALFLGFGMLFVAIGTANTETIEALVPYSRADWLLSAGLGFCIICALLAFIAWLLTPDTPDSKELHEMQKLFKDEAMTPNTNVPDNTPLERMEMFFEETPKPQLQKGKVLL